MKLKYKIRIITVLLLMVMLNVGLNVVTLEENINITENKQEEFLIVTVRPGDTIWKIVSDNYSYIDTSEINDFRYIVDYIVDLNDGNDIKIGQIIKIPLYIKK